ncbi:MAG: monofunctional biosynthetic peptidoglycan transglycosylase [Ignavibacteriae bacterium]|nr:monofunctional biosynthetic peptidoglycan transglycosylase [Ignavibacteriota bacterium]
MERGKRVWLWAKAHKFKAFLAAMGIFFFIELLTIPWFSVANLAQENPAATALMRQRMREAEANNTTLKISQRWIPLSRIPRHAVNAVIVAEDGMFWEHGGFDWYEFQQSLQKNWEKKRAVRGASTITQQLAKNLYLSTSKDPIRKLKEWVITALLEHYLVKSRILEIYLNVIEWGPGVFGIDAAARKYFGRSASGLSYDQALRLAAVIPSPLKHRPTDQSRWMNYRRNIVAQRMLGRHYDVDEEEFEEEEEEQSQEKETTSSQPSIEQSPADSGDESLTMPTDSTDIGKGDSNDVQRRKPAD